MELIILLAAIALGYYVGVLKSGRKSSSTPAAEPSVTPSHPRGVNDLHAIANELEESLKTLGSLDDFLRNPLFQRGVELLTKQELSSVQLWSHFQHGGTSLSLMALEVLAAKEGAEIVPRVVATLHGANLISRCVILQTLSRVSVQPIVPLVLCTVVDDSWSFMPFTKVLQDFLFEQKANAGKLSFGDSLSKLSKQQMTDLRTILQKLDREVAENLIAELDSWSAKRIDREALRSLGHLYGEEGWRREEHIVKRDALEELLNQLTKNFLSVTPKPVVIVGESGVGKTILIDLLADILVGEEWAIFRATASDVMAGQTFVGQLEGQVRKIRDAIGGRGALWVIPNFHELRWAGTHMQSEVSLLDMFVPSLERGEVKLIGETTSAAFEKLLLARPQYRNLFLVLQIPPLGKAEAITLAEAWLAPFCKTRQLQCPGRAAIEEAYELAQQYIPSKSSPGNLIELLKATVLNVGGQKGNGTLTVDEIMETLGHLSGIPLEILDMRKHLDLGEVRNFFNSRVIGQPEAIDTMVDRLAMIKSGLTDPTRPQGVFLFVGPTGTGKTEACKAFAEFLFGAPNRMIRLDMSELQNPDAAQRIVGTAFPNDQTTSLADQIRHQPFSVVLLDEFEKAHPSVWDLFLAIFDDGRLSDQRGNRADFRHAIIIITSNIGSTAFGGSGFGFADAESLFSASSVRRAVEETFRREFFNRIDKTIVFRPLTREVMREILRKELNDILLRRGLRTRAWAIEWDETAIDFLLAKGFTSDLGARPLKRAIDQFLLSPLAKAIVNQEVPQGEQFLFVKSDGERIDVQFVDPNVNSPEDDGEPTPAIPHAVDLAQLVTAAMGRIDEVRFLEQRLATITARTQTPEWIQRRESTMELLSQPGLWQSPARFVTLGEAEYLDRIRGGCESAGSLLQRLVGRGNSRDFYPPHLVQRLAQLVFLIDQAVGGIEAGMPRYALIRISSGHPAQKDLAQSVAFAKAISTMYVKWGKKRNMEYRVLYETNNPREEHVHIAAVAGFSAYGILEHEAGIHVMEFPKDGKSHQRAVVHVDVVPQPDKPLPDDAAKSLSQVELLFRTADSKQGTIVRRYREKPSPLVRDSVSGWRTGNLERILEGDFDLMLLKGSD